jgi:type II secretory pathway component GspD/PulD (secretin)
MLARLLLCLALLFAWPAAAQQELEIIPLRSQTVDRVLPTLLPLVEPGGTLIGANDQLFLRASQRNREEIKRVLATIDRPSRRLIIRVSQNRESEGASRGGEISGRVVIGDGARSNIDARLWDRQGTRSENAGQLVQTVEGGQAFIQVGRTLPIPMRQATISPSGAVISETVVFQDIGRGFFATPRVNGERVTIDISQRADSVGGPGRGSINTQQLSTTVSGRLGEWIELGGTSRQASGNQAGSFGRSTSGGQDAGSIWLLVEEVQ